MTWQRAARLGVATTGLVCAGVIIYMTRSGAPTTRAPSVAPVDPSAALEGGAGTVVYDRGASRVRIVFNSSRRYDDGRMHFEKAQITDLGGRRSTVRADVLDASGAGGDHPSQFAFSGNVRLETEDGLRLETDRALYDDATGVVTMPGKVQFTRGRMSGESSGAVYRRNDETVQLEKDARVVVAPDAAGQGRAEGTAARMVMVRGQKSLRLEEQARIVDDTERMTADVATLYFTDDERALKYLELRGRAAVDPVTDDRKAPQMRADNITVTLHPDGRTLQHSTLTGRAALTLNDGGSARAIHGSWIDLYTGADGRTLTRLDARDQVVVELPGTGTTPGRTITATTLSATGEESKGLTAARFDGHPRFEERTTAGGKVSVRTGTSDVLVLALDGGLDRIQKAEFRQAVKFEDGDISAEADLAFYDEAQGILNLQPGASGRRARVTGPDLTVDAQTIDLFLGTDNLNARGTVTTRSAGGSKGGQADAAGGGLLSGDQPVYGSSETLVYERETGTAVYTGSIRAPARLKQDQTEIAAVTLRVVDDSGNLEATTNVDSVMFFVPAPTATEPAPAARRTHVVADTLRYDDGSRTAVYQGRPVKMTGADGETEGRTLTLVLAAATRALDRMRVDETVYAKMSGGYEVDGDSLTYEAGGDTYLITGKPARVKSPSASGGGCLLTKNLTLELNRQTGSVRSPGHGQVPGSTDAIACDVSIRSVR